MRGDLMLIVDQLNLTGRSPLVGKVPFAGVKDRFVDMVDAYDPTLCHLARHVARQYAIVMHDGVYAGLVGPAYESPAEARLLRSMGADAVGMSTVLETIAARGLGLSVIGFSLITNVHLTGDTTSHAAVIAASSRGATDVARLIEGIVANIDMPLPATSEAAAHERRRARGNRRPVVVSDVAANTYVARTSEGALTRASCSKSSLTLARRSRCSACHPARSRGTATVLRSSPRSI